MLDYSDDWDIEFDTDDLPTEEDVDTIDDYWDEDDEDE